MIALNELLNNFNHYQDMYNKLGLNIELNLIKSLEDERKKIQLDYESTKSNCNKNCNLLAKLKKQNQDISNKFSEILCAEQLIKEQELKLDNYNKLINQKLKKLPNIPDEFISKDISIQTKWQSITFEEFSTKLKSIKTNKPLQNIIFNKSKESYLVKIKNQLFSESNSYQLISCKNNEFIILLPEFEINQFLNEMIDILKTNSLALKKLKSSNSKSSTMEYMCKLNTNEFIKVSVKREFFTRFYNIKYKNEEIDMTKFLNQINLKFYKNKVLC